MIEDRLIKRKNELVKRKPIYKDFRGGDVRHSQASINKARTILGYQPKFMISDGMDEVIDWYIKNLKQERKGC